MHYEMQRKAYLMFSYYKKLNIPIYIYIYLYQMIQKIFHLLDLEKTTQKKLLYNVLIHALRNTKKYHTIKKTKSSHIYLYITTNIIFVHCEIRRKVCLYIPNYTQSPGSSFSRMYSANTHVYMAQPKTLYNVLIHVCRHNVEGERKISHSTCTQCTTSFPQSLATRHQCAMALMCARRCYAILSR